MARCGGPQRADQQVVGRDVSPVIAAVIVVAMAANVGNAGNVENVENVGRIEGAEGMGNERTF